MPEGPEIKRAATRLAKVLAGREIEAAELTLPRLRRHAGGLIGERVESVSARGKAIVTAFSHGFYLYSHNQLYGRWYVKRRGELPSTNRNLRVALHTSTHSALLYSASDIELLDEAQLAAQPYLMKLGPEALDPELPWQTIAQRLLDARFAGRGIGALYLDQGCIAGIGNYLRSELLFEARLHPSLRPKDLTRGELGRLSRATLKITQRAYETAGTTNPPGRVKKLIREGITRSGYRHMVFAREAQPCYECTAAIERISVSSRRLYLCPRCQPSPV
ncbi:MAG: endonuclease VIII [Pseudomonadota bacterium]